VKIDAGSTVVALLVFTDFSVNLTNKEQQQKGNKD
jgi:hypothetical protein